MTQTVIYIWLLYVADSYVAYSATVYHVVNSYSTEKTLDIFMEVSISDHLPWHRKIGMVKC